MLCVIIDPARSEKNLQVTQEMTDDKEHQDHAGEGDDHFFADGRAIKCAKGSHREIRLAFLFLRSITIVLTTCPQGRVPLINTGLQAGVGKHYRDNGRFNGLYGAAKVSR